MIKPKKELTLYNVMFPIWFLLLFPIAWIVVLPVNFVIDSIVLLICAKLLKLTNIKELYKRSIIKIWVIGFASDFIGAGILFLSTDSTFGWYEYLQAVSWNPFDNWYALLFVAFAVAVAGVFIYIGNIKFSLKNMELSQKHKRILALALAVLTAPYVLFYPSSLMNGGTWDELKFMTNHIVKNDEFQLEVALNEWPSDDTDGETIVMQYYQHEVKAAVNEAKKTDYNAEEKLDEPDLTLLFHNRDYTEVKEIPVWLDGNQGYFQYDNNWYALDEKQMVPFLKAVRDVQSTRGKQKFVIIPDPVASQSGGIAGGQDKDGKHISDYPVFEDSRNLYYCRDMQKLDNAVIQFEGKEAIDIYTALETGLVTPKDLMDHGMELIVEERE